MYFCSLCWVDVLGCVSSCELVQIATAKTTLCLHFEFRGSWIARVEDGEQGEKRRGGSGVGDAIARELKAFCVNWGGFNFVSQNMHNTKVLGVGDVFLCGFFFLEIFNMGCAILIDHPISMHKTVESQHLAF